MTNLTPGQAVSIALAALALLVVALLPRWPALARRRTTIVILLALAAVPAHLNFLRREHLHTNEFFHYYVGTKYFAEVGYSGLYDAAVVADAEDDPAHHTPAQGVRSLTTYAIEPRQAALDRRDAIKARFSAGRWAAFKEDVAWFRAADGVLWTLGDTLKDHGYNGTPLVTAILGGVARQPFVGPGTFIPIAAWFDLGLVLLAAALVARAVGLETGAWFLFVWAVNPLNDYGYIGGAYLRTLHLVALAAALAAFARRRYVLSGIGLAVATLLRLFPIVFLAGLLAQAILCRDRARRLREQAPLYLAAALTAQVLIAGTLAWDAGAYTPAFGRERMGRVLLNREHEQGEWARAAA